MNHGYAKLSNRGTGRYVYVSGDNAITTLGIAATQELLGDGDPAMHGYAVQAIRWLRDGTPFIAPVRLQVTPFQQSVFTTLATVPIGRVTTYKALGDSIGCGSYRAVGQALHSNPVMLLVPCHRVVRSDATIGGYAYGTELKRAILEKEGVAFDGDTVKERCILREL